MMFLAMYMFILFFIFQFIYLFYLIFQLASLSEDGQGSWMVMFMTSVMSLYIFHFAYNGLLMLEGKYMDKLHASRNLDMKNKTFMKAAAIATWLGDFLTAWMVTDIMLQVMRSFAVSICISQPLVRLVSNLR